MSGPSEAETRDSAALRTPLARYELELARAAFLPDPAQRRAIEHLERLHREIAGHATRTVPWWSRLLRQAPAPPRGVYLWGGVGRGKTFLVDLFHDCLPEEGRQRIHFHRFMQSVHAALRDLRDERDPLARIAADWSRRLRVLCLDEFHVGDITDAMLLGNLLQALFSRGVVLVTTSNEEPRRLYWNGLQRERFLPAIAALEAHTEIVNVDGGIDYRLRALERAAIYLVPPGPAADAALAEAFAAIAPEPGRADVVIDLDGRPVPARRAADGVVWLDFDQLCDGPRGTRDYIELARCHHTVLLANVPLLDAQSDDRARRFIHLVDELYDRNVNLVVSAAAEPPVLYRGERLRAPYARTASRLIEMRTAEYLARPHLSD